MKEMKLQNLPHIMTKVIQLYETKNSRHSTMIVGGTLSGKSVSWRLLQGVMGYLCKEGEPGFQQVKVYLRVSVNMLNGN